MQILQIVGGENEIHFHTFFLLKRENLLWTFRTSAKTGSSQNPSRRRTMANSNAPNWSFVEFNLEFRVRLIWCATKNKALECCCGLAGGARSPCRTRPCPCCCGDAARNPPSSSLKAPTTVWTSNGMEM